MEVGLRPGELYGLHGRRVDWLRSQIQVIDVMTRKGLRQWPKSKKSHRVVPVPPHILEGMSVLMTGRPRTAIVFTAPEGGPVTDGHFRDRVWYPAVEAARLCGRLPAGPDDEVPPGTCGPQACDDLQHGIRRFAPRIMRHTAASRLVQDGCLCTTSRLSSGTRITPRRSGMPTWRPTRTARSSSPGRGAVTHL